MKLTAAQRRLLNEYRECRASPPSFGRLLFSVLPLLTILALALAIIATFGFEILDSSVCLVTAGMCAGAALRTFSQFTKFLEFWPILLQITDWQRIDLLLEDDSRALDHE